MFYNYLSYNVKLNKTGTRHKNVTYIMSFNQEGLVCVAGHDIPRKTEICLKNIDHNLNFNMVST